MAKALGKTDIVPAAEGKKRIVSARTSVEFQDHTPVGRSGLAQLSRQDNVRPFIRPCASSDQTGQTVIYARKATDCLKKDI